MADSPEEDDDAVTSLEALFDWEDRLYPEAGKEDGGGPFRVVFAKRRKEEKE
eukprot:evm.model.NODE_21189_length_12066_cov_21.074921.3